MVYDSAEIETRWQARWRDARVFDAEVDDSREKFYCLEMFPYPSGYMHMGHVRNYSIGDAMARFQRLMGKNVLYPMGYDSFGMPAENAAKKEGGHPHSVTERNIEMIRADQEEWDIHTTGGECLRLPHRNIIAGIKNYSFDSMKRVW